MNIELLDFMREYKYILRSKNYQSQKKYLQHGLINLYRHLINVGYNSYLYAKKRKRYRLNEMVIGALLHDYYLYDWHNKYAHKRLHGFHHPKTAVKNSIRDFNIGKLEQDIIRNHMWPITLFHFPKSKEAFVVDIIDKLCAHYEFKLTRKIKRLKKKKNH